MSNQPNANPASTQALLATNIAVVPKWDPKRKRQVTQYLFVAGLGIVLAGWIATLYWVFGVAVITDAKAAESLTGVDLAVVLAPVLAAAAGVERLLETGFGIIEQYWLTLVAYLGRGLRWLRSAETEVQEARKWLAEVSVEANKILSQLPTSPEQLQAMIPDRLDKGKTIEEWRAEVMDKAQKQLETANSMMALAEQRLASAERELANGVNSPGYKSAKRAASIVLGLWLGVIVAGMAQLQMFALLGVGVVPARIDVLITGLVIGSGTYPVHSLVGVLQQTKDTLEGAQGFLKNKGEQVRKLAGE
jgi:hypothetical protein